MEKRLEKIPKTIAMTIIRITSCLLCLSLCKPFLSSLAKVSAFRLAFFLRISYSIPLFSPKINSLYPHLRYGNGKTNTKSVTFMVNTSPIGGPGMMEELAIGIGVGVAIAAVVVILYFKKWKQE
ncbi:MAG: hypothetical protein GWO20_00960 [Candidatus Korarchaeota archaeon]|nr:hypothetical protein [Candidatus Korarchaeota archaeon]NIU82862.1 hypothetical protein [Candidatus Thorarchaeota archaeon]NIW12556.1 hypothetical protein [Candidatus Thorarchaeota archaeon]NIW50776.1 hypothetical protein [Candidatus Korarchaeota archaeon]